MNFFEQQAAARRTSTRLVLLMALAIAGIVLVTVSGIMTLVRDEMRSGWLSRTHVVKKIP